MHIDEVLKIIDDNAELESGPRFGRLPRGASDSGWLTSPQAQPVAGLLSGVWRNFMGKQKGVIY